MRCYRQKSLLALALTLTGYSTGALETEGFAQQLNQFASGDSEFDNFVGQIYYAWSENDRRIQMSLIKRSADWRISETASEQPFKISASAAKSYSRPPFAEDSSTSAESQKITNTVSADYRNTLTASLSLRHEITTVENPNVPIQLANPPSRTSNMNRAVSGKVSYDILRGGKKSIANINSSIATNSYQKSYLNEQEQDENDTINVFNLATDLYTTRCRLKALNDSRIIIDKIVKTAEDRVSARVMAQKDYLNFLSLVTSVESQIAEARADLKIKINQLRRFSPGASEIATTLLETKLECTFKFDKIIAFAKKSLQPLADPVRSEKMPNFLAAGLGKKLVEDQLYVKRTEAKPAISPFFEWLWTGQPDNPEKEQGNAALGVEITWAIPSGKQDYGVRALRDELKRENLRIQQVLRQNLARQTQLGEQFSADLVNWEGAQRSRRVAIDLIKILETQSDAGISDSTSWYNARLTLIDAEKTLISVYGRIQKNTFEAIGVTTSTNGPR